MRELAKADYPFERQEMGRADALRFFRERAEPYKVEILEAIDAPRVSRYRQGELIDLCRGPPVPPTAPRNHRELPPARNGPHPCSSPAGSSVSGRHVLPPRRTRE